MAQFRTFQFTHYFNDSVHINFKHDLIFPIKCSLDECFHQLAAVHQIPPFAHAVVRSALEQFVEHENEKDFNARYSKMWSELRSGTQDLNRLCEQLDTAYQKHVSVYANPPRITDEEVFGQAYNRVIHSTAAQQLIQLEQIFAQSVAAEVNKRNAVLRQLQENLVAETERGLQMRDVDTAVTITQLQEMHVRNRDLIETQWNSCISELRRRQRQQLRELVMNLDEQLSLTETNTSKETESIEDGLSAILSVVNCNSSIPVPSADLTSPIHQENSSTRPTEAGATVTQSRKHRSVRQAPAPATNSSSVDQSLSEPWSESFTVQLGRQMRTTCNFRLVRADPNDLLRSISPTDPVHSNSADGAASGGANRLSENALGERLSNALGIYSNDLNGLVILVDKRLTAYRGVKRRLADACERSTEFHFPELGCQLAEIRQTCHRIASECSDQDLTQRRPVSMSHRNVTADRVEPVTGDVYITRHSNLTGGVIGGLAGGGGGISVVFHLVSDSATEREEDRIRSGAPLHCALSAILRTCFDYDITTLSLPLLLVQSVQEYMDVAWRARRAETVFKALKGVLMELSTWRGPTVRAIQFLAPPQLSDAELASFSRIITASFLQPVPVIVPA